VPAVSRLSLTDFRSYADALVEPGPSFVLLYGENGAGKTNLLEAVSLLSPGRGIRGAALSEMARNGGSGGFAVAARLDAIDIGTGTSASAPDRRQVRINGAPASANSLGEWLSVLWLTPAMDRLFTATAGDRRRFLDRLVLALEPPHAHHAARYEAAMRSRNKLLAEPDRADASWIEALEAQMAEHGAQIAQARARTVSALDERSEQAPEDEFARGRMTLEADKRGQPPILLLDEVAAHLDPKRREALFARLEGRGQVWMTATEAALFDGIGTASRFHVRPGTIAPK